MSQPAREAALAEAKEEYKRIIKELAPFKNEEFLDWLDENKGE